MGNPGRFNEKEEAISEINMIPLIDVMLVLLVIFIVTIPVMTHSVRVDLPQAKSEMTAIEPGVVSISIMHDGKVLWNDTPVDEAGLHSRLSAAAEQDPQPEIQVHGDHRAAYGHVAKVMAASHQAGIRTLGFVTQPD